MVIVNKLWKQNLMEGGDIAWRAYCLHHYTNIYIYEM